MKARAIVTLSINLGRLYQISSRTAFTLVQSGSAKLMAPVDVFACTYGIMQVYAYYRGR
ncbi:hypothetical protein KAS24_02015 [Candidatus Bathyarchaeota archaeon]|nr:hypothetical protein [Candidatus Bathyarchaeota archaeon]